MQHLLNRALPIALALTLFGAASAAGPASAKADDAKVHYDRGLGLYKESKFEAALAEFNEARSAYHEAHRAGPEDASILYWIGFLDLQLHRYPEAVEPLEQAIKLNPRSAEAYLNLGNAYDGLKRYSDAVTQFKQSIRYEGPSAGTKLADPYYNLGSVYYKMGRISDAIASYRQAAVYNPKDPYIYDGLGFVLQANGDYKEAITAGEQAIRLDPNSPTFTMNLSLAYLGEARSNVSRSQAEAARNSALTLLSRAAQRQPDSYAIHEAYGETLYDAGHDADAIIQFQKASELQPKQFNPVFNWGLAASRLGRMNDAMDAYGRALAIKPESREALHGLGIAQYKTKHYDDAIKTYTTLTQTSADDSVAWIDLASSMRAKGDSDGEIAALEQALKHGTESPALAGVHRAVAGYYYRKGDSDALTRAQDEYNKSLRSAPDNPDALNGLGLIAAKQKRTDDAIRFFHAAISARPNFDDAYNNLGVAYEAKKDIDDARASYKKALQINPRNALAQRNLDRFSKNSDLTQPPAH